ncbi:MAG: ankyrin repeat domain-containing protein [Bdellovibrionales bacterium]|jgi:ankyrin repeat protein|nr:ankyrin repeat domain-containing protein [Bdellovibrionales bacterium]
MSALAYTQPHPSFSRRPQSLNRRPAAGLTPAPSAAAPDRTALLRAAESGDLRQLRRLIEDGADINAADTQGWTPLMKAARNHHLKAVAELITAGANIAAETRNGWNALSIAVKSGSPQIIALLASAGGKTTTP